MKKETFKKMKEDLTFYQSQNGFLADYLKNWLEKAIYFIEKLRKNKIKLVDIDINDYSSNTNPSVYIGKKRYSRLSKNDYKLALRYWAKL